MGLGAWDDPRFSEGKHQCCVASGAVSHLVDFCSLFKFCGLAFESIGKGEILLSFFEFLRYNIQNKTLEGVQ